MARKVFISRQGLTCCPSCGQHARTERSAVREASCPFCGAALTSAPGDTSLLHRAAAIGRSSLLAASLFGAASLGGVVACSEEDGGPAPADATSDTTPSDTSDTTPSDASEDTDLAVQPPYGIPADTAEDTEDIDVEDAADSGFEPEYGVPPDVSDDIDVEDAADAGIEPDYGIPPDTTP